MNFGDGRSLSYKTFVAKEIIRSGCTNRVTSKAGRGNVGELMFTA
jgi:hypothetical protein